MKFSQMPYERPDLGNVKRRLEDLTLRLKTPPAMRRPEPFFWRRSRPDGIFVP